MKTALAALLAIVLFAVPAVVADVIPEGLGIVFGEHFAFSLKAPKGWMLDNESGVSQGEHAVFYPKGGTWDSSVVVAYANSVTKTREVDSVAAAVKQTIADFHARGSTKYDGKWVKTIKLGGDRDAVIYHFAGDKWGNSEAMAYIVEAKTINFVVLNSRKRKAFEAALPAFENLVASYHFMGDAPMKGNAPPATSAAPEPAK